MLFCYLGLRGCYNGCASYKMGEYAPNSSGKRCRYVHCKMLKVPRYYALTMGKFRSFFGIANIPNLEMVISGSGDFQNGPFKARAGPTKARAGPCKTRAGPSKARAGPSKARAAPPRPERTPRKAERAPPDISEGSADPFDIFRWGQLTPLTPPLVAPLHETSRKPATSAGGGGDMVWRKPARAVPRAQNRSAAATG